MTREEAEITTLLHDALTLRVVFDPRYSVEHHGEYAARDQRAWAVQDQGDGWHAAFETEAEALAFIAKRNQTAEVAEQTLKGDTFAAYWAGSVSSSVAHHYKAGAFTTVRAG